MIGDFEAEMAKPRTSAHSSIIGECLSHLINVGVGTGNSEVISIGTGEKIVGLVKYGDKEVNMVGYRH